MTESISAAAFAEVLRVQGSDLRRLVLPVQVAARTTSRATVNLRDPSLRQDVVCRLGRARASSAGELVGLAACAREIGSFCPVQQVGDEWSVLLYMEPKRALQLAAQLIVAADTAGEDRERASGRSHGDRRE